ncbi:30357_t:CDS:2 [Racocetra persica]|uniref:30357_t:CDS:1 n=1 Tax=Racocetra persica TaxID=160502 RepID=A0ACA9R541_9GLOM|nr:30357_t:CDS:2 [Racocetra persica]
MPTVLRTLEQQRKDEVRAGCHQFMNDPKSRILWSSKSIKEYHRRNETVEPLELEFINQQNQMEKKMDLFRELFQKGSEKQIGSDEDNGLFCTEETVFDAHLKSKIRIKAANAMVEQGITSIDCETQKKLFRGSKRKR